MRIIGHLVDPLLTGESEEVSVRDSSMPPGQNGPQRLEFSSTTAALLSLLAGQLSSVGRCGARGRPSFDG